MSTTIEHGHEDIVYPATIPFVVLHLACIGVIWTGVTTPSLLLFVILYLTRVFAITIGYHRYFSHRTYQTSRLVQFLLAVLCQSTTQRGVIWWAAIHRYHHLHSDTPLDIHSRRQHGFWFAHMGWVFTPSADKPDYSAVRDLTRYPELVWLDRYPYFLPTAVMVVPCALLAGWSGVIVGFAWSTMALYHVTFAINSFGHASGEQPYVTGDDSRNNLWLSLLTMGEGWHNNHHAYQTSARLGFRWNQIDVGYWLLRLLERMGVIWNLRTPSQAILENTMGPGRKVREKVAREIADAYESTASQPPAMEEVRLRVQSLYPGVPPSNLTQLTVRTRENLVARMKLAARGGDEDGVQ